MKKEEIALTPYLLPAAAKGTVLICPGGGYEDVSPREGKPVALAFNQAGYNAFVLQYTVVDKKTGATAPLSKKPLAELAAAIAYIRENAEEYQLDKDKIAVCGFSAGAHLAASLGVYWNNPGFFKGDKQDDLYRPNAMILCYPVISAGEFKHEGSFENLTGDRDRDAFSVENHVSEQTPPTFLWHTAEDSLVPVQNSLIFSGKLAEYKVPFELHIYPFGWHGLSLATAQLNKGFCNEHVGDWFRLCVKWLEMIL